MEFENEIALTGELSRDRPAAAPQRRQQPPPRRRARLRLRRRTPHWRIGANANVQQQPHRRLDASSTTSTTRTAPGSRERDASSTTTWRRCSRPRRSERHDSSGRRSADALAAGGGPLREPRPSSTTPATRASARRTSSTSTCRRACRSDARAPRRAAAPRCRPRTCSTTGASGRAATATSTCTARTRDAGHALRHAVLLPAGHAQRVRHAGRALLRRGPWLESLIELVGVLGGLGLRRGSRSARTPGAGRSGIVNAIAVRRRVPRRAALRRPGGAAGDLRGACASTAGGPWRRGGGPEPSSSSRRSRPRCWRRSLGAAVVGDRCSLGLAAPDTTDAVAAVLGRGLVAAQPRRAVDAGPQVARELAGLDRRRRGVRRRLRLAAAAHDRPASTCSTS